MKTQSDPALALRLDIAVRILSNWSLGEIMEHQGQAAGVARLAVDLADHVLALTAPKDEE
jgi:hypothetical protein